MLMSKKLIQESDWMNIKHSQVVPFYDVTGSVKGCQYIFKNSSTEHSVLNLLDQDINNIYSYQSQVAQIGQKKFMLRKSDNGAFIVVISSCLRQELIDHDILEKSEVHYVLSHLQDLVL
jgi:hypothetical protein